MDANTIVSIIGSVGFPIIACCGLFYLYDKTIKDLTVTLTKIDATLEGVAKAIEEMRSDSDA
ncbi:hypothetical protein EVA_22412 [gut metagenome]|uniref:Uncharacterized protein n=1 Tax=gut metagenome TaxID=749906 RepID=J9F4Q0_9ZZZZ